MNHQHPVVNIFFDLVKISSPSYKEAIVRDYICDFLHELDIKTEVDNFGNVYVFIPAIGNTKKDPILLSAHMDTVEPCDNVEPIIENGIIKTKGDTILGADDKAGIASILDVVTYIKEEKIDHRPMELLFTVQEEIGCIGAQHVNYEKFKSKTAIVLDRSAPVNAITLNVPSAVRVDIRINGRSTHSRSPEEGIHTITMFADLIKKIKYGKRGKEIISNIGIVTSGTMFNVIPDLLTAVGEIRASDEFFLEQEINHWKKMSANVVDNYKGSSVDLDTSRILTGFSLDVNHTFVIELSDAIQQAGFTPQYVDAFGGSDANIIFEHGIVAIPLGQGRSGAHSVDEQIPVQSLLDTRNILISLLT